MEDIKAATLTKKFKDELLSKIKNGEPVDSMFSQYDPYAIRDLLEEAAGDAAGNKHPFDLFEKPELLKDVKVYENPKMEDWGEALLGKNSEITVRNKADKGTLIHEAQHAYDHISQPDVKYRGESSSLAALKKLRDDLDIKRPIKQLSDLKGLEETSAFMAKHFKPDVIEGSDKLKQLINLERIVKGQPLKSIAHIIPLAGAGLIGLGAMNKAQAGDLTGAGLDAASIIDPTGISSAASEINERLRNPEYAREQKKEDYLKALPMGLDIEQQAIDSTEEDPKIEALKRLRVK
jgi:hypothetical protein